MKRKNDAVKLYLIAPVVHANVDTAAVNAHLRACVGPIAKLIRTHIAADPALFAMQHIGEASRPTVETNLTFGNARALRIADDDMLLRILTGSGDPFSGEWMLVRSLVTCRAVFYGYDGQAFVCLPTDAPPIESSDRDLFTVEECSQYLTETDWLDGLVEP